MSELGTTAWAIRVGLFSFGSLKLLIPVTWSHYKQCSPYIMTIGGRLWLIPHDQVGFIKDFK